MGGDWSYLGLWKGCCDGVAAYEFHGDLESQGHRQDRSKFHQTIGWKCGVQA